MDIKVPFLGDGIDSATIIAVLVSPGDTVDVDDTLAEMETDKATAPIPSTAAGTVEAIHVKDGDTVWDIAAKYNGISVADIKSLNRNLDISKVKKGDRIVISAH